MCGGGGGSHIDQCLSERYLTGPGGSTQREDRWVRKETPPMWNSLSFFLQY